MVKRMSQKKKKKLLTLEGREMAEGQGSKI